MVKTLRDLRRERAEKAGERGAEAPTDGADHDGRTGPRLPEHRIDVEVPEDIERIEVEPMPMLICSDHHLGEHGKDLNRIDYVKRIHDRELCAWLEHYAENRIDGQPWRLVINGDFVDFLAVTFHPDDRFENIEFQLTEHEARFGLDNSEPKCVWKLEHIAERHKVLMTYLADFVAQGNHLDMLYGNHDVEFYWPAVQERFVELLIEIYFGGEHIEGVQPRDFHDRVRFHEWFIYVPDRIYIEHGNQYDDFSSFEHGMKPVSVLDENQLAMPMSHLIIRYFVNQYEGFRSHGKDNWTLLDYFAWLRSQGWEKFVQIVLLYGTLFSNVWNYARAHHEVGVPPEKEAAHERAIVAEGARYGMSPTMARNIDDARRSPLESNLGGLIQVTALDKYFLGLGLSSLAVFVLSIGAAIDITFGFDTVGVFGSDGFRLVTILMIALLGVFGWRFSGRITARLAGQPFATHVAPKLDRAAEQLARVVDVPHIVLGHTHKPLQRLVRRGPDVVYTNTGAWIPAHRREYDQLTFAIYDWDTESVTLMEWDTREMKPRPFDAPGRVLDESRTRTALSVDTDELLEALETTAPEPPKPATKRSRFGLRRKREGSSTASSSDRT